MKKNILSWGIRLLVTIGLFVWLFTHVVHPQEVKAELIGISVGWLVAAVTMQALAIYASIWRWNVLLRGQGLNVSHWHLVSTFLIGRFFGTFLPSTIGLDAYRTYDIARRANATTESLAVLIVEKIIGFFALSLLVLITIPAGLHFFPVQMLVFISLAFCVPVTISFLLLLKPGLVLRLLDLPFPLKNKIEGKLRHAAEAVTAYQHQKGLLLLAVFFGVLVHFFTVVMYFCTASAIDAPVTLSNILFAGPLMIAATVGIPAIGGEGVREFSLVGLLRLIGVPESSAAVLGLLGFLAGMSLSSIGGLIFMTRPASYRAEIRSLKTEAVAATPSADSKLALSLAESGD